MALYGSRSPQLSRKEREIWARLPQWPLYPAYRVGPFHPCHWWPPVHLSLGTMWGRWLINISRIKYLNPAVYLPICKKCSTPNATSFRLWGLPWVYVEPCGAWHCELDLARRVAWGWILTHGAGQRQYRDPWPIRGTQGWGQRGDTGLHGLVPAHEGQLRLPGAWFGHAVLTLMREVQSSSQTDPLPLIWLTGPKGWVPLFCVIIDYFCYQLVVF